MIFVYVIKLSPEKYYTGITKNLFKRLKQHDNKQSKFTSHYTLVSLVYLDVRNNYQDARKLEIHIKSIGAWKYINKRKFEYRYYYDIDINEILSLSDKINSLNQLKIILNKKIHLNSYL